MLGDRSFTPSAGATIDGIINAFARRQRGRVARWQLVRARISAGAIDSRIHRQRLVRVHPGIYVVAPWIEVPFGHDTEVLLAAGPGAVLSHHSAVVLWRLRTGTASPVHVTIPEHRSGPRAMEEAVVHRSTTLTRDDVRIRDGLPVTAPARTLLDVAGTDLRDEDVARLLDEALHVQRLVRRRELDDLLARAGGHPGAPTLRRVLGKPHRRTESRGERKLLALVRLAGLPEPETQVWLGPHRVDFLWREQRVALEVDAYGTHGSPRRFESDRRRDADRLTQLGIATLRVTEERIDGEPYAVVALLTRAVCGDPR